MTTPSTIRIYVACLASYNNGVLHGAWIDADQDADAIQSEIDAILRTSRFPSVTVDCPTCDGRGHSMRGIDSADQPNGAPCPDCNARGTVPSAEEYAIHDHEGFGEIRIGESESIAKIAALATLTEEHGYAFTAWYSNGADEDAPATWADAFSESYLGTYRTLEDWAAETLEDTGSLADVPDSLRNYIDFAAWARDAELGGDIWTARGGDGVLVFDNH